MKWGKSDDGHLPLHGEPERDRMLTRIGRLETKLAAQERRMDMLEEDLDKATVLDLGTVDHPERVTHNAVMLALLAHLGVEIVKVDKASLPDFVLMDADDEDWDDEEERVA